MFDQHPYNYHPKPQMPENVLLWKEISIERKAFTIALRENSRGRFIRIVERSGNHSASIIIPSNGLKDFYQLLVDMIKAEKEIASKSSPPKSLPPER